MFPSALSIKVWAEILHWTGTAERKRDTGSLWQPGLWITGSRYIAVKAISFLKMNSTFLTYPFSSKFHLSMWPLLRLLVQVPEDFAACLKRWETTNTLTNYLSSLAIAVALHALWSDLPAGMNTPLEEAVRAVKVVLQWGEIQWWLIHQAVPKPCLLLAWAEGPAGRENQHLGGLIRSRLTRHFHVWKYFSRFQKKKKAKIYMQVKFCVQ